MITVFWLDEKGTQICLNHSHVRRHHERRTYTQAGAKEVKKDLKNSVCGAYLNMR